jgi:site-specific DNA-methyltransferase (adenine-specific)
LGDCADILPTLGKVDAIVTDPPYEFRSAGGAGIFKRQRASWMESIRALGLDEGFDHSILSGERADSAVVFCHNDQLPNLLPYVASEFDRFALCAWHKTNPMPVANKHYRPDTEFYIHAWNKGAEPQGDMPEKLRITHLPVPGSHPSGHPSVKPIPLMAKIVRNVAGAVILDPFMGTGSTGVAAVQDGRDFIGIERDPSFFDWACKRIDEAQRQGSLFGEAA